MYNRLCNRWIVLQHECRVWTHRSYFPPCPGVRCGPALDTGDTAHWPHSRPAPPQLQTCNTRAGIPAWFVIIPGSSIIISPGGVCICLQVCTLPAVPPRPRLTELGAATPVLTFTPASPAQPAQPSPAQPSLISTYVKETCF